MNQKKMLNRLAPLVNSKTMVNKILLFLLFLFTTSCKSQIKKTIVNSDTQKEVLAIFFSQLDSNSYVDTTFYNTNRVNYFQSKYKSQVKAFKSSDSICKNSSDINKKRISCPIADSFQKYDNLLSDTDLSYIETKYLNNSSEISVEIENIIDNYILLKHSEDYYKNFDINIYSANIEINEFPSVRIENLYFNQKQDVAIISYAIASTPTSSYSNFFIIKFIDGIWWKPLGSFKI